MKHLGINESIIYVGLHTDTLGFTVRSKEAHSFADMIEITQEEIEGYLQKLRPKLSEKEFIAIKKLRVKFYFNSAGQSLVIAKSVDNSVARRVILDHVCKFG